MTINVTLLNLTSPQGEDTYCVLVKELETKEGWFALFRKDLYQPLVLRHKDLTLAAKVFGDLAHFHATNNTAHLKELKRHIPPMVALWALPSQTHIGMRPIVGPTIDEVLDGVDGESLRAGRDNMMALLEESTRLIEVQFEGTLTDNLDEMTDRDPDNLEGFSINWLHSKYHQPITHQIV